MLPTNRQSFLAELSSLLTFMQDSDRKTALSMYSKMFDDAPNEQELLSNLVSPTRQAVKLARVYDPSASSEGSNAEFLDEISSVQPLTPVQSSDFSQPLENQTTLFNEHPSASCTVKPARRQAWKDEPYQSPTTAAVQDVDAFISGIKVNDEISKAEEVRAVSVDELSNDFPSAESVSPSADAVPVQAAETVSDVQSAETQTVAKTNVPLLILYTIFAVPITSLIIVLVISLALGFLGLASGAGYAGYLLIFSAFGGFAVFADIMVVLGASLVLIALAILFMWIFVWLLGGVIVAAVKGAINLGGRLCVREVQL